MTKYFPIMDSERLTGILWEEIIPYEQQAIYNHDQSLEELAKRGGLDVVELWCVVNNMHWREFITPGISHNKLQEVAIDCENKLIDRFKTTKLHDIMKLRIRTINQRD